MASIREKGPYQFHAQIRRKGWPQQSRTFRTKKEAQAWAREIEHETDQGVCPQSVLRSRLEAERPCRIKRSGAIMRPRSKRRM